jgi:hypothetical protein
MSWYKVNTAHDSMPRGLKVFLEDTEDVARRVARGYLARTEPPTWQRDKKESTTDQTELST